MSLSSGDSWSLLLRVFSTLKKAESTHTPLKHKGRHCWPLFLWCGWSMLPSDLRSLSLQCGLFQNPALIVPPGGGGEPLTDQTQPELGDLLGAGSGQPGPEKALAPVLTESVPGPPGGGRRELRLWGGLGRCVGPNEAGPCAFGDLFGEWPWAWMQCQRGFLSLAALPCGLVFGPQC